MANSDLQQFNGTQAFPDTADVGTNADEFLIPTDSPVITAQSNLTDEAPVYPGFTRLKNYILGLRAATIGDFTGAVRKTFRALQIDGTGGADSTLPDGEVYALSHITSVVGHITALAGNIVADIGDIIAAAGLVKVGLSPTQRVELRNARLGFLATTTGSGDANPPQGTSIKNELRAINIPKAACFVLMTAPNAIGSFDGCGISSVAITAPDTLRITFAVAFDNTRYCVQAAGVLVGGAAYMVTEVVANRTTGFCDVRLINVASATALDFTTTAASFSVAIDGRQTT